METTLKTNPVNMEDKEPKKNWSLEVNKDGKRYSVRVRQCENGFITCITTEENGEGNWEYEEKEFISKTNPLASSSALNSSLEKEDAVKMKEAVKSLKLLL